MNNMTTNNPFQNSWTISKFLFVIASIQISVIILVTLDLVGLGIPLLRNIVGFIYLTFVPGILILRLLNLEEIDVYKKILYSVGLSISFLMFTGFLMNLIYPLLNIKNPISNLFLICTITVLVLALSIICYLRDNNQEKNLHYQNLIGKKDLISYNVLLLCLLPFLAIIGTYLMNSYQNNIILFLLIIIIGAIIILAAYEKIPNRYYPFAIFVIALSLLFHSSLISNFLLGWDINKEFYIANLVITNGIWDMAMPGNVNSMLSITILAPIYSIVLDMSLIWVYKIIYPLIFSLVPLGLYKIFQKQLNSKISFFSCLFFVFLFVFFIEMIQLARQEIAELFFVLLILLIIDRNKNIRKSILLVIFALSLIVSHYGLSYIYLIILLGSYIIVFFIGNIGELKASKKLNISLNILKDNKIQFTFVLLFIVSCIGWYVYTASSHSFITAVKIGDQIASSIYTDFFNPDSVQGLQIVQSPAASLLHSIYKLLQYLGQFLIVIGFLSMIKKTNRYNFDLNYLVFSMIGLFLLFLGLTVPYFASSLNTSRLYQISLILLAPYCVVGTLVLIKLLNKPFNIKLGEKTGLKVFSIYLIVFLLFNTGFIYEISGDLSTSYSLNSNTDYPKFNSEDISGAKWIMDKRNNNVIYADEYRYQILYSFDRVNIGSYNESKLKLNKLKRNSYIYLGSYNVLNDRVRQSGNYLSTEIIYNKSEIYDNGNSRLFLI